jgi:hypothetical protein
MAGSSEPEFQRASLRKESKIIPTGSTPSKRRLSDGEIVNPSHGPSRKSTDDGPNMETYHEGTYRCSRVGHADCRADVRSVCKCGARVAVELLVRRQRLLRAGEVRSAIEQGFYLVQPVNFLLRTEDKLGKRFTKIFQLARREDAWRRPIDGIDAVFLRRPLPGACELLDARRIRGVRGEPSRCARRAARQYGSSLQVVPSSRFAPPLLLLVSA